MITKISRKLLVLLALIFVFTVSVIIFIGFSFNIFTKNSEISYSACGIDDYACLTEAALINADNVGLNSSLDEIYNFYLKDNKDPVRCHKALHSIGTAFYDKFAEGSFIGGAQLCIGAYYHGVLLGSISDLDESTSPKDLSASLNETCELISSSLTDLSRTCIHGVGHASYMFYENLQPSIDVCLLSNYNESYMDSCLAGTFMEPAYDPKNDEDFRNEPMESCLDYGDGLVLKNCLFYSLSHKILDSKVTLGEFCSLDIVNPEKYCEAVYGTTLGYTLSDFTDPRFPSKSEQESLRSKCAEKSTCKEYYDISFDFLTGVESGSDPAQGAWKPFFS